MSWSRLLVRGGVAAGLVAIAALVPLPRRVSAPALIEPAGADRVYVSVGGRLLEAASPGQRVEPGDVLGRLQDFDLEFEVAGLQGQVDRQRRLVETLTIRRLRDSRAETELETAREVLEDLESRLRERRQRLEELVLRAPAGGTVLPPPIRSHAATQDEPVRWAGSPLDERNRGASLKTGTLFCLVGDPDRLEAVVMIDQSDVDFVRSGQSVRVQLEELPGTTIEGTVAEISAVDLEIAPRELLNHEDLPTRTDASGRSRPASASYQARVKFDPHPHKLLFWTSGTARIDVEPQSLAARFTRAVRRTFRIEL